MEEAQTTQPQEGTYGTMEAYPEKIKFESDKPVVVSFPKAYTKPKEMPNTKKDGVFYIFDCLQGPKKCSISTSSWTLLKSLKSHEPLAGKTLIITKKNVAGKNMFYVSKPDSFGSDELKVEVDKEDLPDY